MNDIPLSGEVMKALNKVLIKNTTLELLNLGNCGIDDEGLSHIKNGLSLNSTLKVLVILSYNYSRLCIYGQTESLMMALLLFKVFWKNKTIL